MPEESAYSDFSASKKQAQEEVKKSVEDNIQKGQEKQVAAYAKRISKKYKEVHYEAGDEILLLNVRRRGRKGGRLQPDFSGPYIIQDICGKRVTLQNSDGKTLNTKYNIDHIKPYRRPEKKDVTAESQVDEPPTATRPSVIRFAKKAEAPDVTLMSTPVKFPPETPPFQKQGTQDEGGLLKSICS